MSDERDQEREAELLAKKPALSAEEAREHEKRRALELERKHAAGGATGELDAEEERRVPEEERINAAVTHEVIRREGIKELARSPSALAWSGLAAGLSMGLSLVVEGILHHALPETTWRHAVATLGYPIGFLVVTLGSQQLYTENTVTPIVPLMAARTGDMLRKVLTLWVVVLLANLVGTFLFAWAAARSLVFPAELQRTFRTLALQSMEQDALSVFARAIAAGWIIAIMVWMLPASGSSMFAVIIVMTWIIGAARLSHVIVGSVKAFYLVALGDLGLASALGNYIVPSLLGNTIGGVMLVAAVNHAQVEHS